MVAPYILCHSGTINRHYLSGAAIPLTKPPDDEKAAILECYKLNYSNIPIYKAEVAKFKEGSPDKLKDISPYQKIEDSNEEYDNLSDEEKLKLFEYLEKEHGVENIPPVKLRRPRP